MNTVSELLSWAITQLNSDEARSDANTLLSHVTNKDRSWFFTWPDKVLDSDLVTHFKTLIKQRSAGTPVAYLTGKRSFWTLNLSVNSDTLIPRPETEHLVEQAISIAEDNRAFKVLDLGTGSGAIALAIASERPNWQITATDFSQAALKIAQQNASDHRLHNIRFIHSDWFSNINKDFDLIVSNPPYICDQDEHLQQGDLRFEPITALASGSDGLDDIRIICLQSQRYLKENGWLMFEHGWDQGPASRELLGSLNYKNTFTAKDLSGNDRVTGGQINFSIH